MVSMLFIVSEDYENMPLHFVIVSDSRPAIASPFVLLNDITKPGVITNGYKKRLLPTLINGIYRLILLMVSTVIKM